MILKYISIPVFLISFIIGLFFVYMVGPNIKTIFVYPTPTNYKKMQYKDKSNQCFQFKPVATHCPLNPLAIKSVPVQN
jgi:hypothetical protein